MSVQVRGAQLKVHGMAELHAALKELGAEMSVKVLRAAGRRAMKPVLEAAKSRVAVDTGVLRDSIVIGTQKLTAYGGEGVVAVGLRIKKTKNTRVRGQAGRAAGIIRSIPLLTGAKRNAAPRWHFVETGTSTQPARPFLRPALDQHSQTVVDNLATELRKGIERAQRKGRKG